MVIIMKYCEKCKVSVTGIRMQCPLCQRTLVGDDSEQKEVFPYIPAVFKQFSLLFRLAMLISIIGAVVCVSINFLLPKTGMWSFFVVAGIACLWFSIIVAIYKRKNLIKNLMYQVVIVSVLCIVWDYLTHWRGWSLDYVIPIVCVGAMLTMTIISRVMNLQLQDYIIYLIIDSLFGIIPVIFLLTGILDVVLPTIICIGVSIVSLSALIIFEGENMKAELKKRLHI